MRKTLPIASLLAIVGATIGLEGYYSNHAGDRGGKTKYGITEAVARRHGHTNVKRLTKDEASTIYLKDYMEAPKIDTIPSKQVLTKVFDAGVNVGTYRAVRWYQTSLNAFSSHPPIAVDGFIGQKTIASHNALIKRRGERLSCELLIKAIDAQQGQHYISLGKYGEPFRVGWFDHRIGNVTCK